MDRALSEATKPKQYTRMGVNQVILYPFTKKIGTDLMIVKFCDL